MSAADRPDSGLRRRPTPIAASLFSVLGALLGGTVGASAGSGMPVNPIAGLLLPLGGAIVLGLVGYVVGKPIDRRGYPENGGWRGVLVCLGAIVGIVSGLLIGGWGVMRLFGAPAFLLLLLVLLSFACPFLGALLGARVGEAFDRLDAAGDDVEQAGESESDAS